MFDALRSLISDLTGRPDAPEVLDERLATAALLVHTLAIDGAISPRERAALHAALMSTFGLDRSEADQLIEEARERDLEAVDLYGFTSVLKRSLDHPGRERVIELMWEIIFADGNVHEFEDNIVWRVAELLGVSSRDRIRLRKRIEAKLASS
ncbi:TerB family tellurite resistance protein [Chthonobacter albigriseus]|uniref:tellurite resistance TerB family protein n=1 Tax=Chthonobacter albigriseus TaxID=1683161 RepID=UPI0015EF0473|nr:TerB family tellurite resistance protein [Chthonobacter albigriseus]